MMKGFLNKIKEDKKNYNKNNTDESKVIAASYFSNYKNTLVIKFGKKSACYLFLIWFGRKIQDESLVKHEYGHKLQRKKLGMIRYIFKIFIPSFTCNMLLRLKKLPYDYYSLPWEYEADALGGVKRDGIELLEDKEKLKYKNLCRLFIKRRK